MKKKKTTNFQKKKASQKQPLGHKISPCRAELEKGKNRRLILERVLQPPGSTLWGHKISPCRAELEISNIRMNVPTRKEGVWCALRGAQYGGAGWRGEQWGGLGRRGVAGAGVLAWTGPASWSLQGIPVGGARMFVEAEAVLRNRYIWMGSWWATGSST